jgi:Kelch motif
VDARYFIFPERCPRRCRRGQIDNSVFVLGGFDPADSTFRTVLNEVERLDQIGAPWQVLPPLNTGRAHPAAAALDGRLYAIGGYPAGRGALSSVEVFEPAESAVPAG